MTKKAPKRSSKLPLTANGTLPKADVLERWQALPAGKLLTPEAAEYGSTGSAYERDSIRVCGSLKFLDQVLSNLKGLLRHENTKTVLSISYAEQKEKQTGKRRPGQYTFYVQVKEKARTTRAKAAAPPPARAPSARAPKASPAAPAPAPAFTQAQQDALAGLATLGYKRADAEQRLAAVVERHGQKLAAAEYIKLVLAYSR